MIIVFRKNYEKVQKVTFNKFETVKMGVHVNTYRSALSGGEIWYLFNSEILFCNLIDSILFYLLIILPVGGSRRGVRLPSGEGSVHHDGRILSVTEAQM